MSKFKSKLQIKMSMVIPGYGLSDTGALCGGVGFDNEEIKYSASLAFKF
jgi:hypothetical protein